MAKKKTAAQLDREIAAIIAGDAELEGRFDVGKQIRRQEGAKSGALLGYTESAIPVYARARAADDLDKDDAELMRMRLFPGWTNEDHGDASRLHKEAAEVAFASGDQKFGRSLESWSRAHTAMQAAKHAMPTAIRAKVLAMLRKIIKREWEMVGPPGFTEMQGELVADRALDSVRTSLGAMLGGAKLIARGGLYNVEIWNVTGPYLAPEFVFDLATGRVR